MATVKTEKNNVSARNYDSVVLTLENCLLDSDKLESTPSTQDGLTVDDETDLRILGAELIQTAGILLKLPQTAMATGQVLFQRFYYSKSFIKNQMDITAMGCLCLASKIEESPRRIRDVINVFQHIKQIRDRKTITPVVLDSNYVHLKNQVIKAERRVLKELGFCVHVQHPHKTIVTYMVFLKIENQRHVLQYAWNAMNDALRTDIFVRYSPETIACACIYLAARHYRVPLPNKPAWYLLFDATEDQLQDIAVQILMLYRRPKRSLDELESIVDKLRTKHQELRIKSKLLSGTNTPQQVDSFSPGTSHPNTPNGTTAQVQISSTASSVNRRDNKENFKKEDSSTSSDDRYSSSKKRRRRHSSSRSPHSSKQRSSLLSTKHKKHNKSKHRRSRSHSPMYRKSSSSKHHRSYESSSSRHRHYDKRR